jgi:hypothetical protein
MPSEKEWIKMVEKLLKGKTIVGVRWLTKKEAEDFCWSSRPVVLLLNDGTSIYPSRDDEGNDGGALLTTNDELSTIPVIR